MPTSKPKTNLLENLVPILLLASIALAFVVGVLWQKVSSLEGGNVRTTTQVAPGAGEDTAPQPAARRDYVQLAASLGISEKDFTACYESGKYKDKVQQNYQSGVDVGVQGTPGNFIVNSKGEVWSVPGAFPYEIISVVVEKALGKDVEVDEKVVLLSREDAAKLVKVTSDDHVRGSKNPKAYLIEYSDYDCGYCGRFHVTAQQLVDNYSDLGWVYRHFPLDQNQSTRRGIGEASECVAELGGNDAFWKFTDALFGT
jgi:protein-disulfide isomerase